MSAWQSLQVQGHPTLSVSQYCFFEDYHVILIKKYVGVTANAVLLTSCPNQSFRTRSGFDSPYWIKHFIFSKNGSQNNFDMSCSCFDIPQFILNMAQTCQKFN